MCMKPQIKLIAPEQWTKNQRGDFLEKIVSDLLRKQRFRVTQRVRFTGMEIDVLAENLDTRERAFVECKFKKDTFSADVISKLIGNAHIKDAQLAYLFTTAPPSKDAKGLIDENIKKEKYPKLAYIGAEDIAQMYIEIRGITLPDLASWNIDMESVGSFTLLILGEEDLEVNLLWVVEQKREGIPCRAVIIPASPSSQIRIDKLVSDFKRESLWLGLEIVDASKQKVQIEQQMPHLMETEEEVVTSVSMADRFDDYRPCRPRDFVGRYDLQKDVWSYLEEVRTNQTSTRIICFTGPSGFGKSSVVLKLADRFRNRKWRNKLFLYAVDVRSAKGPLFVMQAVRFALQRAVDDGFIKSVDDSGVSIESTESFLSGTSIQDALENLRSNRRVLIIFFDQFEELFTKESLLPTFETFQRLAFEVDSLQSNIVLGFCWRTGITIPHDHPAYFLWHDLRDKRLDFRLTHFTSRESSLLLSQLENYLREKLDRQLRRRLLEQCQGFPWLLKKLCVHIYRQLSSGTSPQELLARHLDVRILFDEDLEPLTKKQNACLRYIAENSPVDIFDVTERFGQEVPNWLYSNRLVVRAGQRYAVYWDIFRDYLIDGKPPSIPLTYIPQTQLSMALRAFDVLQKTGPKDFAELAKELRYSLKTIVNIAADLLTLLLAGRGPSGKLFAQETLTDAANDVVAEHLANQFKEHVILRAVYNQLEPGTSMSAERFRTLFAKVYPASNFRSRTLDTYVKRILPWFVFAGVLETDQQNAVLRPIGIGKQKGLGVSRHIGGERGIFLCASGPRQAIAVALRLAEHGALDRIILMNQGFRNAAADLVCLGLAKWTAKDLIASSKMLKCVGGAPKKPGIYRRCIKLAALNSPFLTSLAEAMKNDPVAPPSKWAESVSKVLGKSWSLASAERYIGAGRTWLRFFAKDKQPTLFGNDN